MARRRVPGRGKPDGPRSEEEAGCLGKVPYPSEAGARAALKLYQQTGTMRTGDGVDAYRCRFCTGWHLGH
jgi:hypothetical protein